jgi:hypothetical protein
VDPPNNEKLHPPAPDRPTGPDPLSIHIYLDAKRENASVDDIQELIENAIRRMQVSETPPEDEDQIHLILEEKDDEGRLPVHIACLNRAKVDVVRLLVSQSPASLHTKDTYGWYPLHIAVCFGASASVIQYLLDKNPEALWERDMYGHSCIQIAEQHNASEEILTLLRQSFRFKPLPIATPIDIWNEALEEMSSNLPDAPAIQVAKESVLDPRFFKKITTRNHRGNILEAYKAVHNRSTMVLLSCKTQTPLAALTLKADDQGCLSMLTARPPPKGASEAYFQGMLNQVDESFTLTISNLSDEGMINFDVLHSPCPASQVNPGPDYAINKTSVISPNQSYSFEADQRNICRMVLGGKTKQARFPLLTREKKIPMTVKEAEAKAMGLDFYLNVVAEKDCKSLVNKFAEGTAWKVLPGFVRRVTVAAAMVMPTDRIVPPEPLQEIVSPTQEIVVAEDVSSSEEEESELLLPREEDMEAAADIVNQAEKAASPGAIATEPGTVRIRLTRQEIVVAEDVSSNEEEESELLLQREEDMEAAADIVIQAEKAASPGAIATEPGAVRIRVTSEDTGPVRTTNDDPPSVIAVPDDTTEVYTYDNFAEELEGSTMSVEALDIEEEESESELLPRAEDMEAARDIVIQAAKAASPGPTATEPGAVRIRGTSEDTGGPVRTTNEDPPSMIAVRDGSTEVYDNFAEELDSVTQSMPLLVASLAREGSPMTVEALEERFKQITEMLVSLEQRQKEFQSASQQKSNSSLTSSGQYSEALEQRFEQITDMLTSMQQQQVEAFRRYEEAQSMNQHRPSFDEPREQTTSVASSFENESSQDLSALSMNTHLAGEHGSFSYLRNSLQREELRRDLPKPDPPAMQVLVEDVLEKLDPDGKIQTNEADSNLPQERLTPVHSVRRILEGEKSESTLDRKLPARNAIQERPASAQSRQTTDSEERYGDESQRDRKLPSRNTSEDRSTSDRSQKVVDTGGDASPQPPVWEPVSTLSFPDESAMRFIQNGEMIAEMIRDLPADIVIQPEKAASPGAIATEPGAVRIRVTSEDTGPVRTTNEDPLSVIAVPDDTTEVYTYDNFAEELEGSTMAVEALDIEEEESESELLPRLEDMEAAGDIVIQAEKAAFPGATATEPGAVRIRGINEDTGGPVRTTNEDPPSVIAVRDGSTEVYDNFAEELDSVVASLAREGSPMTVEALEERFKQITEMLVSLEQRQKEFQSASQQKSNSSLTSSGQYSEALEQRFEQITDMLTSMQQQQVEAFRRYEEAQSMNQHRPSFDEPREQTTSVASSFENESSQDLSALSMNTHLAGEHGSFSYLRNSLQREELRRDLPKPDPPAMQVLVEDVLEKLDPDGKIQTNEADSNLPQERLTPVHSVRRILEGEKSESTLDRKLPARNAIQERPASAQSRQTTDSEERYGDESQRDRKLPSRNTSEDSSTSDRSQKVVDTGGDASPQPPVREPVSTLSFPDESAMRFIQNGDMIAEMILDLPADIVIQPEKAASPGAIATEPSAVRIRVTSEDTGPVRTTNEDPLSVIAVPDDTTEVYTYDNFAEELEGSTMSVPRAEDMEAAGDIVIQAEKAASPGPTATEPGAVRIRGTSEGTGGPVRTTNEDPPSLIAVCDVVEELDSVTQSIPLLVASSGPEGSTMTVEALEERFKQITEMLVSLEQRQKEFQSASQQISNSSLTSVLQYSEALEQRFEQITDMLTCMQQQQVEAFYRYEEAQSMNEHRPSFDEPRERTTSVASSFENESSLDLFALSMSTCRPGEQRVSSRSSIDPSGSFSYLRYSLQREELRRDLPKPDPPAMQVLVEDVLEKLDPDGKIQTNEADSNLPQERLTPVHSVRRILEGEKSESTLDRKLPARNAIQERPASAQSRQTTDSEERYGDESQRDRKLPSRNTSEDSSTSDRSQKVVDTGGDASPQPPVWEPVSTLSFPDESAMRIIQNGEMFAEMIRDLEMCSSCSSCQYGPEDIIIPRVQYGPEDILTAATRLQRGRRSKPEEESVALTVYPPSVAPLAAQTAPRFRRGRRLKPQKTKRNETKNILTAATRLWRGRRSKPLDSSLAVKVSSTQAGELKHGYKVQSLADEETHQVSSGHTIEFDCEHHSEPAVLSMSIWKGMKFQVVSNVELQIAESVLTLVKNEGKALIRSSNEIVKAECCIMDGKSKVDTIVCTCGHQCLNHKNVADVYRCPICSSPVTAFVQIDGLIIE